MAKGKGMSGKAASRIQSAGAKSNGGKTAKGRFRRPRPEGGCKERILKSGKRVATPNVAVSVSGFGWPPFAFKLRGDGKAVETKA